MKIKPKFAEAHYNLGLIYIKLSKKMMSKAKYNDLRLVAARTSITGQISIADDEPVSVKRLLDQPELSAKLLSNACIRVFEGDNASRTSARNLDYLAYGIEIQQRSQNIAKAIFKAIGDQKAGDLIDNSVLN